MLADLPVELLSHIVTFIPTAEALRDLSSTCRKLHAFVEHEGWKIFLRTRFPSYPAVDQPARYVTHSLTTLSKNWDRKAFVARYIEPAGSIVSLNNGQPLAEWKRPRGQTMGFQPSLDSYEELAGGSNYGRREILVWSAGTDLLIRAKESGPATEMLWSQSSSVERQHFFDHYHQRASWFTFRLPGAFEGRDDITCLSLLRPGQKSLAHSLDGEQVILGTANGDLNLVTFTLDQVPTWRREIYNTDGRAVRAIHVSSSDSPFLAAAFVDSSLALYPVHKAADTIEPISHIQQISTGHRTCRIWSTRFLSSEALAVGLGPSTEPVHVYGLTSSGFSEHPIRKFGIDGTGWGAMDRLDLNSDGEPRQSSVYPITSLPAPHSDKDDPNVFLSGGYDGIVRLHDMRSPAAYETCYWDPTDDGAVYALQTVARERLVVGSSRHSIVKFFDLRVAGGRQYHYADVGHSLDGGVGHMANGVRSDEEADRWHSNRYGWNLFLNPRNQSRHNQRVRRNDRRSMESPVYALTCPSPFSPSVFAGVENNVVQLDFNAIADRHPDPMFQHGLVRMGKNRAINVQKSWNPRGDVLNLAAYEQGTKGAMRLRVQAGIGKYEGSLRGWDERWRDSSDI